MRHHRLGKGLVVSVAEVIARIRVASDILLIEATEVGGNVAKKANYCTYFRVPTSPK